MFAKLGQVVYNDLLVTLLRGSLFVARIVPANEERQKKIKEGYQLVADWAARRRELIPDANRLARRIGFTVFGLGILTLFILQTFFLTWLKSIKTEEYPILGTQIAWMILAITMSGLIVALLSWSSNDPN